MKKLKYIIGITILIFSLVGCGNNVSIQDSEAIPQLKTRFFGSFGFGLSRLGDKEGTSLFTFTKADFNKGNVLIEILAEGIEKERNFIITPLLNGEKIKVDFENNKNLEQYEMKIKNGINSIKVKTDNIQNGVVTFLAKEGDTILGMHGYTDYENIKNIEDNIEYSKLKTPKGTVNKEIRGKSEEEILYAFKIKMEENRLDGDNYGYKVFINNELIKIDDKYYTKIFKENNEIFQDEFKFKLPKKKGEYDIYITREVNSISKTSPPFAEIVYKNKVIVE